MFLSKAMRFVIKAAYARRKIFEKRQKIISIICHHTKSDLFLLMTEMAIQLADRTEKIFNRDEEVEHYREDSSLKSKELNIGTIRAGETKQISYQIAVAEVSDDNQILSGEIKLTGDGIQEQKIEMQSNKIANGSLKANLEFAYDENVYLGSGDGFSLLLTVKNIITILF